MNCEVRGLIRSDIELIGAKAAEVEARSHVVGDWSVLVQSPYSWTFCVDDKPIACGGWVDCGHGVAIAWALVSEVPRVHMVAFCRAYRRKLAHVPFHWLEAHTAEDFESSRRWLEILGFKPLDLTVTLPDGTVLRRFVYQRFAQ